MIAILRLKQKIRQLEASYHRPINSVALLAVSKSQSTESILEAYKSGQNAFGENYLQEALVKIAALKAYPIEWHFIGAIQSNKTKAIAENFSWVHSLSDLTHAKRLGRARLAQTTEPLNVCLQVNISQEESKSGINLIELNDLAKEIKDIAGLRLRGLMTLLQANLDFEEQKQGFRQLFLAQQALNAQGFNLDTLSMGMSHDYSAAIAEGATLLRIGSAVFGERI